MRWIISTMRIEELMRCRVCGLWQSEPPWGTDGKTPTYDFCPCCGVEFGYGDATQEACQKWRKKWLEAGAQWVEPKKRPKDWDLRKQLRAIGIELKE